MRFLPLLSLLFIAAPASASDLQDSLRRFCNAGIELNRQGFTVKPGSTAATYIAAKANQSDATYRLVWAMAKASSVSSCKAIW